MKTRISVIMPVYNCEDFIAESINSILNQSFKDLELIIIDGGSTDKTPMIIDGFKDKRLKVIVSKGLGLTESRNEGLLKAKGKLVAFQDADDVSHPQRLAKQYLHFCQNDDLAVLGTSYYIIDEQGKIIGKKLLKENINFADFKQGMPLCNGSVMFRKDIVLKEGLFDSLFLQCEDYELYSRLSKKGYKIVNLREFLYYLRVHKASISARKWQEQLLYACLVKDVHFGNLKKETIKEIPAKDHEQLYSILSLEAKKEYHLNIVQKYIKSKQYYKGLNEFLKIAKLSPKEAIKLTIRAIQNPNKVLYKVY